MAKPRWRLRRLCSILAAICAAGISAVRADDPLPYALKQVVSGDEVFFFDAGFDELVVAQRTVPERSGWLGPQRSATKVLSNILVHAIAPRPGYAGRIQAVPGLDSWVDDRGHIHSLNALEAQRGFNDRILRRRPDCAPSGCLLTARREVPLSISTVPLTGILDLPTLRLPLLSLEERYDAAARRLDAECARRGAGACEDIVLGRWARELSEARELLDRYGALLSSAPLRVARPIGRIRSYSRERNHGRLGAGLEVTPAAAIGKLGKVEYFTLRPSLDEAELRVAAGVAVDRLDAEWRARAEASRLEAARQLSRVEYLSEAITESYERVPSWR